MARKPSDRSDLELAFGPASRQMLIRAGIHSLDELKNIGSITAYQRAKTSNAGVSLNLLWAIEGVLTGRDWRVVAREDRLRLLLELECHHAD